VKISTLRDGDNAPPPRLLAPNDGSISAIDFSPDGAQVIVGSATRFSLWDVERGAKVREYAGRSVANEVSFAPDGQSFYIAGVDGYVRRRRTDSGEPLGEVKVDPVAGVYDVRVSPDGRMLAAAGDTETVALIDAQSFEIIRRHVGHRGAVYGAAFHPARKRLATSGSDHIIRIWDVETGTELITLRGHRGGIQHVQFSPDGRTLASTSDDGTVKLWRSLPR
jgi:WD40 repeat protein